MLQNRGHEESPELPRDEGLCAKQSPPATVHAHASAQHAAPRAPVHTNCSHSGSRLFLE